MLARGPVGCAEHHEICGPSAVDCPDFAWPFAGLHGFAKMLEQPSADIPKTQSIER